MNFCSRSGNQGFPIPITGQLGIADQNFIDIQKPPEIYSAFATRRSHARLLNQNSTYYGTTRRNIIEEPSASSSTLTYGPDRFALGYIQVVQPLGGSKWPFSPAGTNVADAIFTFENESGGSPTSPRAIHLIVPLFSRESVADTTAISPTAELYFQQTYYNTINHEDLDAKPPIQSLSEIFKDFRKDPGYVMYSTCLQVRIDSGNQVLQVNQVGLYFPSGWILPLQLINNIADYTTTTPSYEEFRLSRNSRRQAAVSTVETPIDSGIASWRGGLDWSPTGRCYKGSPISVSDPDFTKRFNFIGRGLISFDEAGSKGKKALKSTFQYRCMPLDQAKDIDGEYVLLDPATGKRTLKETLNPTSGPQAALLDLSINPDAQSNMEKFATIVGIIAAVFIGIVGLSFAVRFVLNRQGTDEGNEQAGFFARMLSRSKPQST